MDKIPHCELTSLIENFHGTVGLYIHITDSGETFTWNADHVFPSASVIKLPMLALLLKDVSEGRLHLEDRIPIHPSNRVGGTGILYELDDDYIPSLSVLARLMIVLSDNTATNQIIDLLGMNRVNEYCLASGYKTVSLMRKMLDAEAVRMGRNNYMSAGDAGLMLSEIAAGRLISKESSEFIIDLMEHQQCRNKLPAMLPAIPSYASSSDKQQLAPGTVLVANKTGDLNKLQHDVGIFTLPDRRRYVISAFTGDLDHDVDGISLISQISRIMYDALK